MAKEINMSLLGELGTRKELENKAKAEGRLPPGQSLTLKWPVLHYGSIPHFDPARWDFQFSGEVEEPKRLTWNRTRALPQTETLSDFHCVTRWSRLDNEWKGVLFTDVMKLIKQKPTAQFASILAEEGYTANVPLEDLLKPNVVLRVRARRRTAHWQTRWPAAVNRSAPLRLEKRQMGSWIPASRLRPPGFLGTQRLPRLQAIHGKSSATSGS